jgi:hypothetical protein
MFDKNSRVYLELLYEITDSDFFSAYIQSLLCRGSLSSNKFNLLQLDFFFFFVKKKNSFEDAISKASNWDFLK